MASLQNVCASAKDWAVNYCANHKHPVNAVLHMAGVPMVAVGLARLVTGRSAQGWTLIGLGYLFQFVGHSAQGNEVGEVALVKKVWRGLNSSE